jgi:hypothetical protein
MTVVELTRVEVAHREQAQPDAVLLDGRYRLDALVRRVGGTTLWQATDQLLCRPVAVHLLPAWGQVPPDLAEAVQACARVNDVRLATVFDVDYDADRRYIVSEWVTDPNLEQLLRTGLPGPALATTIVAEAAEALAAAHRAGRPHLRLSMRCVHWGSSDLKITGLGIDAALSAGVRPDAGPLSAAEAAAADTAALASLLYAMLTGYWPGDEPTTLPPAPRNRVGLCEPRQLRPGIPPMLNAIVCHALRGQAGWGAQSISTPAQLAVALRATLSASRMPAQQLPSPPSARHARNCPDGGSRPAFHAA